MTPEERNHLEYILRYTDVRISRKYVKGNIEHNGNLLSMTAIQLADEAIDECLDQLVYLITLQKALKGE